MNRKHFSAKHLALATLCLSLGLPTVTGYGREKSKAPDPTRPFIRLVGVQHLPNDDYRVQLVYGKGKPLTFHYYSPNGGSQGRYKDYDTQKLHPDLLVVNTEGNLAALNMKPIHKQGEVFIALPKPNGTLALIKNFDAQVETLCDKQGKGFGTAKVWAKKIEGRNVYLRSFAWDEPDTPNYQMTVSVSPQGKLRLVSHRVLLDEQRDYL